MLPSETRLEGPESVVTSGVCGTRRRVGLKNATRRFRARFRARARGGRLTRRWYHLGYRKRLYIHATQSPPFWSRFLVRYGRCIESCDTLSCLPVASQSPRSLRLGSGVGGVGPS